jgi:hypothetical protein
MEPKTPPNAPMPTSTRRRRDETALSLGSIIHDVAAHTAPMRAPPATLASMPSLLTLQHATTAMCIACAASATDAW